MIKRKVNTTTKETRGEVVNKFWRFWKLYILAPSIPISALTVIISICMLDSESWIPTIVCTVSLLWLLMVLVINDPARDKKKRRSEEDDIEDFENYA